MDSFLTYRGDETFDPVSDSVDLAFDGFEFVCDRIGPDNVLELLMCFLENKKGGRLAAQNSVQLC
jgi:hypothetical protein